MYLLENVTGRGGQEGMENKEDEILYNVGLLHL